MDRSKVIAPCFVFHGWWSGSSPGFLLILALQPSTRVKPLAGVPGASLSHCRALHKNGNPNSGLFSRPRLAVDEREHGLPLGDHLYLAFLIFIFVASPGVLAMIHILRPLSRPVFADGGRLRGHSHRPHRPVYLLPRVPGSPTASLDPRSTCSLRASRLVRSSPWRSFPSTFPLVFLPLIRDGRHCGWHGAPRFLSLARCRRVGWTLLLDL